MRRVALEIEARRAINVEFGGVDGAGIFRGETSQEHGPYARGEAAQKVAPGLGLQTREDLFRMHIAGLHIAGEIAVSQIIR